jgi:hypothetical protein
VPVRIAPGRDPRLELVNYWASGGTAPVWFLADPKRTDLELIDAVHRLDVVRYRWAAHDRPELSGTRPMNADWYRLLPPRWFVGEGWSLTPETGGVVSARGTGPDRQPIAAYVRRGSAPLRVMVGGRHLGGPSDPAAMVELAVEGRLVDRWPLTVAERNFLRFIDVPEGMPAGEGGYGQITLRARAEGDRPAPAVAIRQFDTAPASDVVWGYGAGWHEAEYVYETGLRWRWASERSMIEVRGPARPLRLTLRGESPLRYFDAPPTVTVRAAGRAIGSFQPAADFTWSVTVPADVVAAAAGSIAIETTRVFIPAESGTSADARHLGLRIYECTVATAR